MDVSKNISYDMQYVASSDREWLGWLQSAADLPVQSRAHADDDCCGCGLACIAVGALHELSDCTWTQHKLIGSRLQYFHSLIF